MKTVCVFFVLMHLSLLAGEPGKELFIENKCVKCHSVESLGIETTSDKEPEKIIDLSDAGSTMGSAEEIKAFLMRETKRNDKKHKNKFKGSDEELDLIIQWLQTLKK